MLKDVPKGEVGITPIFYLPSPVITRKHTVFRGSAPVCAINIFLRIMKLPLRGRRIVLQAIENRDGHMMQAKEAPIEYSVYTFDRPSDAPRKGDQSWKRIFCSADRDQALFEARTLYETRRFQRVEIKEKFFDSRLNRTVDRTFKILDHNRSLFMGLFTFRL